MNMTPTKSPFAESMSTTVTVVYSSVGPLDIKVDILLPPSLPPGAYAVVVFFHGGGIVTGDRKGLAFQPWLVEACAKNRIIFISADYRLLQPSIGFSIIEDVKTLFTFLNSDSLIEHLPEGVRLDLSRLVSVGESGGGYPALASALYATPRPKGLMMQFPMGGQMLSDWYLQSKSPEEKSPYFAFPSYNTLEDVLQDAKEVSEDPVPWVNTGKDGIGSARGHLLGLWWHQGSFIDHVTGKAGFSAQLREIGSIEERERAVPEDSRDAVLQLGVKNADASFPNTLFIHGEADQGVKPAESIDLHERLESAGAKSKLLLLPGAGHGLLALNFKFPDLKLAKGAHEIHEEAVAWLKAVVST